jgi:integrase
MTETNSASKPARVKPAKPHPNFPLTAHPSGQWCKRIRQKTFYFGRWEDPQSALDRYLQQKDDLFAGRQPKPSADGLTIMDLTSAFLQAKEAAVTAGELKAGSRLDYLATCKEVTLAFGKRRLLTDITAEDFAQLRQRLGNRGWAPSTLSTAITRIRVLLKFASDAGLVASPLPYAQALKKPSKKSLRVDRAKRGVKLFTRDEIRKLLDAANVPLKAMLYLAINAGLGNSDCGSLRLEHLDLDNGHLDYPRSKTGVARRSALWPETVAALRAAIEARPEPADPANATLVFVTKHHASWCKADHNNPVTQQLSRLMRTLGINGRRGLGFYTLRHIFRTVADEAGDQVAVDYCMGHESGHMSTHYREKISDARLRRVSDFVWAWLFGPEPTAGSPDEPQAAAEPTRPEAQGGGTTFRLRLYA